MKQFLIEWCINLIIVIVIIIYVGNFCLGCYLLDNLDDNPLKEAIYLFLWVIFYAVTTVTCYMVFFRKK